MFINKYQWSNNIMRSLFWVFIAGALSTLGLQRTAAAYQTFECNGQVHRGIHENVTFRLNRYSISEGGQREADVLYAINEWNLIEGVENHFSWTSGSNSDTIDLDDDNWDIQFSTDTQGANAVTWEKSCPCSMPYSRLLCTDGHRFRGDIVINPDLTRSGVPDDDIDVNDDSVQWRRATVIHELGHELGLQHEDRYEAMSSMGIYYEAGIEHGTAHAIYNGSHPFTPHPDDINFALAYHRSSGDAWEWAASSWHRINNGKVQPTMYDIELDACPGEEVPIKYSLANRGTVTGSVGVEFVLSDDRIIDTSDVSVHDFGVTGIDVGEFSTNDSFIVVPNTLTIGETYYIGVIIDPTNQYAETIEDNNATYLATRLHINEAGSGRCYNDIPSYSSSSVNTVEYYNDIDRMWFEIQPAIYGWRPTHITLQIQPTDWSPLDGTIYIVDTNQYFPLSGWYTDITVPYDAVDPDVLAYIELLTERDIRLEWWAFDTGVEPPPNNYGDPNCEVDDCIPMPDMNTDVSVPINNETVTVRLSDMPIWAFNTIYVSFRPIYQTGPLGSGTVDTIDGSYPIPLDQNSTYYTQISFEYAQPYPVDLEVTMSSNSGYIMRWWAEAQ